MTVQEYLARVDAFLVRVMAAPSNQDKLPCCAKGCHACCSEPVYTTEAEANWIIASLTPQQRQEVTARLWVWVDKIMPIAWMDMPDASLYRGLGLVCPLLKDGLCSVYERRPMGCRTWFALGNPADCDMPARTHQKFMVLPDAMYVFAGKPPGIDGIVNHDHLGLWLARKLLKMDLFSGSRQDVHQRHLHAPK